MSTYRCDCGDTECASCGTAQGTREDNMKTQEQMAADEGMSALTYQEKHGKLPLGLSGRAYQWIMRYPKEGDCEVCGKVGAAAKACRFEKACSCWRGVPCK